MKQVARWNVPPKRLLNLTGLHSVISQSQSCLRGHKIEKNNPLFCIRFVSDTAWFVFKICQYEIVLSDVSTRQVVNYPPSCLNHIIAKDFKVCNVTLSISHADIVSEADTARVTSLWMYLPPPANRLLNLGMCFHKEKRISQEGICIGRRNILVKVSAWKISFYFGVLWGATSPFCLYRRGIKPHWWDLVRS